MNPQANSVTDLEGYIRLLRHALERNYDASQRCFFVLQLAEAKAEAQTRPALDSVWGHLIGRRLDPTGVQAYLARLDTETGIAADFARLALSCCAQDDNLDLAVQAARERFAAVGESWDGPAARAEIHRQLVALANASWPVVTEMMIGYVKGQVAAKELKFDESHMTMVKLLPEPGPLLPFAQAILSASKPVAETSQTRRPLGPEQLPGLLTRAASLLAGLKRGEIPAEMIRGLNEASGRTAPSEQSHTAALEDGMRAWPAERRVAFAAALGERWLVRYQAFADREGWGDPGTLRAALDAVWDHVLGRLLRPAQHKALSRKILEAAPDTEDFDAPEALATCEMIDRTLDCCREKNNLGSAVAVALAGCECFTQLAQGPGDTGWEEHLWQDPATQAEIKAQLALLRVVGQLPKMDRAAVNLLRQVT